MMRRGAVLASALVALALAVPQLSGAGVRAQALGASATSATTLNPQYRSSIPSPFASGHAGLYGWGAATMGDGTVLVGDIWNHDVVHFDKSGNNLGVVLTTTGGFNPYGLAVNPSNETIYVGSSQCCTVEVWTPNTQGVYTQQAPITDNGFRYPSRLAVAADGDIFVADMLTNAIFIFNPAGTQIGKFGTRGTGNGQFKQPRGIAFDNSSPQRLFVVDSFNFRVQILERTATSTLTYLGKFGSKGTGQGQFFDDNLRGIAVDSTSAHDWAYVVDPDSNYVHKFDISSNSPTWMLDIGGNGRNSNPVCCTTPAGLFSDGGREDTVDGNGNLWVGDMPNFRVQVFSPTGAFQFLAPSPAQVPPAGEFNYPQGVAVDSAGNITVTDSHNQRLEQFSASGAFAWQEGRRGRFDAYAFAYPQEIAADPNDGSVVVADTYNNFVKKYAANGTVAWQIGTTNCGTANGVFCHPYGVAVGPDSRVYVADTANQRIEVFTSSGAWQSTFTAPGGALRDPRGIAVDQSNGNVYVATFVAKEIFEFNPSGGLVQTISNSAFVNPWDVAVDSTYIYLTDNGDDTVKVLSKADNSVVATFGGAGHGSGQLSGPEGMSLAPGGVLWVADTLNDRIDSWCVTCAGATSPTYVRTIGTSGQAAMYPSQPAVDSSGNVAVADTGNDRVEFFAAGATTPTWSAGVRGEPIGGGTDSFNNPRGVAIDSSGNVFVADTGDQIVQVLNKSTGAYVRTMNYKFASPYGVSVGTDGSGHERILVSDASNGKVYVFDTSDHLLRTILPTKSNEGTRSAATDSNGNIYVADFRGNAVDMYSTSNNGGQMAPTLSWGTSSGCQDVAKPYGIAIDTVDSTHRVYVSSSNLDVVLQFDTSGNCVNVGTTGANAYGQQGTGAQQLYALRGVAVGTGANPQVYAADLWGLKILTYTATGAISTTQPELGNGTTPAVGGINEASGVAVTSSNVFVTDTVNQRMQRFTLPNGTSPLAWSPGGVPESPTGFNWPAGVGVDPLSGNVWVADTRNNVLDEFTASGVATGRTVSTGNGSLNRPLSVSFDPSGNMYVADTNNDQVLAFNVPSTGAPTFLWAEGTTGSGTGNFSRPGDVIYDGTQSQPRLLVADTNNSRIVVLTPASGAWVGVLAMTKGTSIGQVLTPGGVTVASNGMIWVADSGNNRVQEFNPDGSSANELVGGYGSSNTQFNDPLGIQVGPDGLLYVADAYNDRVQVYQPV